MNLQERQNLPKLWLYSFVVIFQNIGKLLLCGLLIYCWYIGSYWLIQKINLTQITNIVPEYKIYFTNTAVLISGYIGLFLTSFMIVVIQRLVASSAKDMSLPFGKALLSSVIPFLLQIVSVIGIVVLFLVIGAILGIGMSLLPFIALRTLFVDLIFLGFIYLVTDGFSGMTRVILIALGVIAGVPIAIHSPIVNFIFGLFVLIYVAFIFLLLWSRFLYAFPSIAVQNKGPFEAIVYSWRLTRENLLEAVLARILFFVPVIIGIIIWLVGIYVLYVNIPLHFADSFDLTNLTTKWKIVVNIVIHFFNVWFYISLLVSAIFQVLILMNRSVAVGTSNFTPLPAVEIPNVQPAPVEENHVEEGLPPETDRVAAQQAKQPVDVPQPEPVQDKNEITGMFSLGSIPAGQTPQPKADPQPKPEPKPEPVTPTAQEMPQEFVHLSVDATVDDLQISQASINTSDQDANEITQHLNQVYTPTKDNIVQYGDEDRMPTILFDDEMAKELEKTVRKFPDQPNKDTDTPPDPGSIKISK